MDDDTIFGSHPQDEEVDISVLEGLSPIKYAIRLENVSRNYDLGGRIIHAIRDINLDVNPGDLIVIYGPSGSGKTTLLNIIGAIDIPSSGRVTVMDVPIGDYDETFRATFRLQNTGFIFQSYNLISTLTAVENVMFPMQLVPRSVKKLRDDAKRLLRQVKLEERLDHLPWQLSSGEQQRVAIARAMANDPPIILADEPTANLDEESSKMVSDILLDLNRQGKTVVVMTHDERLIRAPSSRLFHMSNGELIPDE